MADSLVLTGVKGVKKHTGTEMLLTRPKRGGDSHLVKEWWKSGVSTMYATCTIFDVTTGAGTVKLALDSNRGTNIRIDHDGAFGFTFIRPNEIKRGALFTDQMELIEHYVFPAISGGKVMTVIPPNAASRPNGSSGTWEGIVDLNEAPMGSINNPFAFSQYVQGESISMSMSVSGSFSNVGYSITSSDPADTVVNSGGSDLASYKDITFSGALGMRTFTMKAIKPAQEEWVEDYGATGAPDTPLIETVDIEVIAASTPDITVTIDSANGTDGYILSGDVSGENATINLTAGQTLSITNNLGAHPLYIKTAAGDGTGDQVTEGTVTGQGATNGEVTWDTTGVTPGTYYYQCSAHANMNGEIVVS
jgi:plastocyanin